MGVSLTLGALSLSGEVVIIGITLTSKLHTTEARPTRQARAKTRERRLRRSESQLALARRQLYTAHKRLQRDLDEIQSLTRRPARLGGAQLLGLLKRVERNLTQAERIISHYYQADRAHLKNTTSSPETLKLRDLVWTLLHRETGLYRVVDGVFCLRSERRRDLYTVYQALGDQTRALKHSHWTRLCESGWLMPKTKTQTLTERGGSPHVPVPVLPIPSKAP